MKTADAKFRLIQEESVCTLELLPELNKVQWSEIDSIGSEVLSSLESRKHPHVIVDLSALNYMGSAMVALIVRVWKAASSRKGKLSVVCPHPIVKEVLQLAALDKHWTITDSMEQARLSVGASKRPPSSLPDKTSQTSSSAGKKAVVWVAVPLLLMVIVSLGVYFTNANMLGIRQRKIQLPKMFKQGKSLLGTILKSQLLHWD